MVLVSDYAVKLWVFEGIMENFAKYKHKPHPYNGCTGAIHKCVSKN